MTNSIDRRRTAERAAAVAEATHSAALEGLSISAETTADGAAYIRGEIDIDEVGRRVRARYGLG